MIEVIIAFVLVIVMLIYVKLYYLPKKILNDYKKILQKLGYKVYLHSFQFLGAPAYSNRNKNSQKYGDPFYFQKHVLPDFDIALSNIFNVPVIDFLNPQLTQKLYQPQNVYIHYKMPVMIQNIQKSLGHGIPFSQGLQWKRRRAIMNTVFNYDFIIQNIPKIIRICEDSMNAIELQCKQNLKFTEKSNGKIQYNVKSIQIFAKIFSNVILECFFGCDSTQQKINNQPISTFVSTLISDLNQQNFQLPILIFGPKFGDLGIRNKDRDLNRRLKILRDFGNKMIKQRLAQLNVSGARQKYQDIVQALVIKKSLKNSHEQKNIKLVKQNIDNYDFKQLLQEFCTFFTAGTQTTSHFTQMMIYYIVLNPKIQQRLRKQINEIIKSDEDITKENLKKLHYIEWIQNQTTRFYGPGTGIFTRIAQKDHYISNIPIKKGMGLQTQPTVCHFNEKYYKNPLQFIPQRWEKQCNGNPPYTFGGFGGGPRNCIGKHLAMLQNKIAIIKFMKRYQHINLPKKSIKDIKLLFKFMCEPQTIEMTVMK